MSIERAEQLKREWTDKYVIVNPEVAQLRRFQDLTGTVKTVNMNCRALVEFDGPEDISWYDIDIEHLQVVDAPREKKKPAAAPVEEKAAPAKKAPAKTGGKSPLELAREQAAGKKAAPAKTGGKSPLELAREQAAAKKAAPAKSEGKSPLELAREQAAAKSAEEKPAGKKLSPLEMARQQAAARKAKEESGETSE